MVTLRLGHTLVAALFMVAGMMSFVFFSFIAVELHSLPAAVCALVSAMLVVRLGWVLRRRRQTSPNEVVVMGGARGAAVTPGSALTFARLSKGMWSQPGVVMLADHGGIFLPMGRARPLLVELALGAFVPTTRFADVSLDVGGTTPEAMADAALRHGGLVLGTDWCWNGAMRWLHRDRSDGVLILDHVPPHRMGMFRPAAKPTAAELRHGTGVAMLVGLAGSVVLVGLGAGGALWRDDLEILFGFGAYAVLLLTAVGIGVVVAKRRLG